MRSCSIVHTVNCNDCYDYQEICPCIKLSLLRRTTAVRMQRLVTNGVVLTSRLSLHLECPYKEILLYIVSTAHPGTLHLPAQNSHAISTALVAQHMITALACDNNKSTTSASHRCSLFGRFQEQLKAVLDRLHGSIASQL